MRKHQTRWVALISAAAISTSGLVGLAGPAAADEDTKALSWPVVSQGVSSYSLDGYRIAYLPPGLDRYGINANSTTDRQGDSRSQLSWVQGPDQLYGRVAVLRSENLQDLDDLRSGRYSHLADSSLEELPESETFEHGAYLAEETGDLFWLASPGVAVTTHLQPDRWESDELVRMAESVAEPAAPVVPVTEETEEAETDEAPEVEAPEEKTPEEEAPQDEAPEDATPEDAAPVEDVPADEDAPEEAPEDDVTPQTPQDEAPEEEGVEEEATDTASIDEVSDETPVEDADEDGAQEADLPEATTSHEAKACLVERFVDLESGSTDLDQEQMAPASQEFVEQALNADDLDEADLDRLLAIAWYYGDDSDKVAAIDECAQSLGRGSDEVEDAVAEVADQIGALVEEANEAMADAMDQAEQASSDAQDAADAASVDMEDPVGAEEWEELWDSLPWSIPAETS